MEHFILIKPSREWLSEIKDYKEEYLSNPNVTWIDGASSLADYDNISDWVESLMLFESYETLPNKDFVTGEQYIFVRKKDQKIVGMLHFRHELNDYLLKFGGHIGYSIVPSERQKGYATQMLGCMLNQLDSHLYPKILLTCNDDNIGSRNVIERNGGLLENKLFDDSENKWIRRYWVTT